jgi:hypothetical protein
MANIPDLPVAQPVEKPMASVAQVREGFRGENELAEDTQRMALGGLELEGFIRKAQEHVDTLAANNDLTAAYAGMRDDFAKTTASGDVADVLHTWQDNVAHIVERWSGSPAAREIELNAARLAPEMQHEATMQRVKLLVGEGDVALDKQLVLLQSQYANPVTRDAATDIATNAIQGMVDTGLHTKSWAEQKIDKFKTQGQEQQIEDAIAHPDPKVNQNMWDELNAHPEDFPNVPRDRLDAFKSRLLSAVNVHDEQKKRVQDDVALNKDVPDFLATYKQPDGTADTERAMTEIERREKLDPAAPDYLTVRQGDIIEGQLNAHNSQLAGEYKKNADKLFDHVKELEAQGKLKEALTFTLQHKEDFEKAKQDHFSSALNSINTSARFEWSERREQQTEANQNRREANQELSNRSEQTFSLINSRIANDEVIDPAVDIDPLVGKELTPHAASVLRTIVKESHGNKSFQEALKYIDSASQFSANTDETNAAKGKMAEQLHDMVRQEGLKGDAIMQRAQDLVNSDAKSSMWDKLNDWWNNTGNNKGRYASAPAAPAKQVAAPKVVERRKTASGKILEKLDDGTIREGH